MMETIQVQFYAGVISSLIFSISNIFMIRKAYKTNDLKSYSPGHLALSNLGNLIHWIYISSLPFGPIWFLHAYYTIVTALMLYWYFRYKDNGVVASIIRPIKVILSPIAICICGCLNEIWDQLSNSEATNSKYIEIQSPTPSQAPNNFTRQMNFTGKYS
jgi:hypothetical protein